MQQTKNFLLIVFCGVLFSCTTIQKPVSSIANKTTNIDTATKIETKEKSKKTSNQKIPTSFNLSGAIAVNNKGKGWNANLNWYQQGSNYYTIRLNGPLGGKTVVISKKGGIVTYQEGNKIIKAHSDNELLKQKTNISLPVKDLYYWVRGLPAPGGVSYTKKTRDGNMEIIKQHGFTIIYSSYTNKNGIMLPNKIRISGNNVTIKLVIKNWN